MSQRSVAALAGIPATTLWKWLDRGFALPDEEPYGSFALEYAAAERGLDMACGKSVAHWVNSRVLIVEREQKEMVENPDGYDPTKCGISGRDVMLMQALLESRRPSEYGNSSHREQWRNPRPDEYLNQSGLEHEQIVHALRNPDEQLRKALVAAGLVEEK